MKTLYQICRNKNEFNQEVKVIQYKCYSCKEIFELPYDKYEQCPFYRCPFCGLKENVKFTGVITRMGYKA